MLEIVVGLHKLLDAGNGGEGVAACSTAVDAITESVASIPSGFQRNNGL